jgi:RNA polymerase sigma-70 factor (ECF subfamily)
LSASDPDLELVRDLASQDADVRRRALGELYERHHRRVFNVAFRVLGDWSRAQDVTQEVFLQLAARIGTFRGDAGLTSWMYRITVNRAIDVRRREGRRPAWRMGDAFPERGARRPRGDAVSIEPPEVLERELLADRVRLALDRLSPKLRAILVLRYLEGLSYDELAEVLDCSMGTVKSRLNRAHTAMERELGDRPRRRPPAGGP